MSNAMLDFSSAVQAQSSQLFSQFGPVMTRADIALAMGVSVGTLSVMASRHGGAQQFFPVRLPGGRARYATAIVAAWLCGVSGEQSLSIDESSQRGQRVGRPRKQHQSEGGGL